MPGTILSDVRVLVVDDTLDNLTLTGRLLATQGAVVSSANSAYQARKLVETHEFDIILLDIRMPEIDGFMLLRELRRDPRTAQLPIVALTAYAMTGDRDHMLEQGFDSYIPKPMDPTAMFEQIRALVEAFQHAK